MLVTKLTPLQSDVRFLSLLEVTMVVHHRRWWTDLGVGR